MTILNYLFAILMMILAVNAPESFFAENAIIEMLEVCALLLASAFCFIEYRKKREFKSFFLTCGIILLFCVGRELSWGRVFFLTEEGQIIRRKDWIIGPYIYYILSPFIIAALIHAYKTKFIQNAIKLLKYAPIMIFDFALAIMMIATSIIAEDGMLPESLQTYHFAIEESAEVVLYFVVAMIIASYSRKNLLVNLKK